MPSLINTYKALTEAGASEESARKAIDEIDQLDSKVNSIETRLSTLEMKVNFVLGLLVLIVGLLLNLSVR